MVSQSERFERQAEEARWQLAGTLEELRGRVTPERVFDQLFDYARTSGGSAFLRNLAREVRENPMPVVLIGIGIAWLMLASNRTSREAIAGAADAVAKSAGLAAKKATDIGTATSAAVVNTTAWGRETVTQVSDRASDVARTVSDRTAELADRTRGLANAAVEKAGAASAFAGAAFEKAKRPFIGASDRDESATAGVVDALYREREAASTAEAAAVERR
jgi:Protein of unknown function (DUF3618)